MDINVIKKVLNDAKKMLSDSYNKAYCRYKSNIYYIITCDKKTSREEEDSNKYCDDCIDNEVLKYKNRCINKLKDKEIDYRYCDCGESDIIEYCDSCEIRFTNSIYVSKYGFDTVASWIIFFPRSSGCEFKVCLYLFNNL